MNMNMDEENMNLTIHILIATYASNASTCRLARMHGINHMSNLRNTISCALLLAWRNRLWLERFSLFLQHSLLFQKSSINLRV